MGSHDHQTVVLELLIDAHGKVAEVHIMSGQSRFAEAAVAATGKWRFDPATKDGVPVPARIRLAVDFTPTGAPEELSGRASTGTVVESPSQTSDRVHDQNTEAVEIVVSGERPEANQSLSQADVRELPGAFGDAFRAVDILPGVVPIVSGLPYFYVRGAPPGNVGYYFDGVRVPVLFHFAAGPGVLHPAFVNQVDLYAGAYPARYGRFAGAIVVGESADPQYRLRGEASIRIIDSGGMAEIPFADGAGSAMVGGRFSYAGLVVSLLVPDTTVNYWDYQSRTRFAIDRENAFEVLAFGSGDFVSQAQPDFETGQRTTETIIDMGFHRVDLRWDRQAGANGSWRNAVMFGLDEARLEEGDADLTSKLLGLRSELKYHLDKHHQLRAGADILLERLNQDFGRTSTDQATAQQLMPPMAGSVAPIDGQPSPMSAGPAPSPVGPDNHPAPGDADFDLGFGDRTDFTAGVYADVVMDVASAVTFTPGLRLDLFTSRGDTALGIDPRLRVRYGLSDRLAIIHALGVAHQMPSFPVPIPGSNPSLRGGLQRALQYSSSVEAELGNGFTSSWTLFQSVFFNMTDLIGVPSAENNGLQALGSAYGFEAMVRRSLSRQLGGFASYTLSRSNRFVARYAGPSSTDRTHIFNAGVSYNLGRNWRFGKRLLFYTGLASQPDSGLEPLSRTPPFWRIDWRLQKRWPRNAGGYYGLVLEVLNTTLNQEVISENCDALSCFQQKIGPITVPSIGFEAAM